MTGTELQDEKLRLEIQKFLETDHKLEDKKYRNELYKSFLLTVAVTVAVVTAYFKFMGA